MQHLHPHYHWYEGYLNALPQNQVLGAGKNIFVGADAVTVPTFQSYKCYLHG